jgi:hypothetical protein
MTGFCMILSIFLPFIFTVKCWGEKKLYAEKTAKSEKDERDHRSEIRFCRLGQKASVMLFAILALLFLLFKKASKVNGIGGYCVVSSWIHRSLSEHKQLFESIHNHDLDKVRQLFFNVPGAEKIRDDQYKTPLHIALQEGNREIILFLIENSKDVNQEDGLFFTRYTPLHYAVFYDKQIIEALLKRGANINAKGYREETPLEIACRFNRTDAALLLMENGKNLIKY